MNFRGSFAGKFQDNNKRSFAPERKNINSEESFKTNEISKSLLIN